MSARNASDHVPSTAAFRQRLTADHTTPAAGIVHSIASDPLMISAEQGGTVGGAYWWDPLAVVAATVRHVERFERVRIGIQQTGSDEGATRIDRDGTPVHIGVAASADRFHEVFLAVLNHRPPPR